MSSGIGGLLPNVMISSIGGHRSRMAAASFMPSKPPGMSMSVNTTRMSGLVSKIRIAPFYANLLPG